MIVAAILVHASLTLAVAILAYGVLSRSPKPGGRRHPKGMEYPDMAVSQDVQDFCTALVTWGQDVEAKLAAAAADKASALQAAADAAAVDKAGAIQAVTDQLSQDHADEITALKAALASVQPA